MTENVATAVIMSKVMGLLNQADHPNTGAEESATFRAKAQELMQKYRLAEEQLIATDPTSVSPEWITIDVHTHGTEFSQSYVNLAYYAAEHAGSVRYRFAWTKTGVQVEVCGYAGDLRMMEWVYASMRAVFQERIEPGVRGDLTDEENIWRLRSAGITRRSVAQQLWNEDTHAAHAKVGRIYKEQCAARGEVAALDGRGVSATQYRAEYAKNFVWEMYGRLRRARDAADGTAGALVFHGRKERIDEAFYERYPRLRPSTDVTPVVEQTEEEKAREAKAVERYERKLARQRERREVYGPTQAELADTRRRRSPAARAGREAGVTAARQVELDRASNAQRLDEGSGRTALEG